MAEGQNDADVIRLHVDAELQLNRRRLLHLFSR